MASHTTATELRNMQVKDLQKEITSQKAEVARLNMAVTMQKEKNSAKYKHEKKQLARMETVLAEKLSQELLSAPKKSTVSAPKSSTKA